MPLTCYKHKRGFTLSEVLITLAIIGVIASITIPVLITKINNHIFASGLKHYASTLSIAVNQLIAENANLRCGNPSTILGFIGTKVQFIKTCANSANEGCWHSDTTYPRLLTGANWAWPAYNAYPGAVLIDGGSILVVGWHPNCDDHVVASGPLYDNCAAIFVDVNGVNKPPNVYGRDVFGFYLTVTGLYPRGSNGDRASLPANYRWYGCYDVSTGSGDGERCTTKVLTEGEMNY